MPRVCAEDGCPEQVSSGYCPAHRRTSPRSPSSTVTGTSQWRRVKNRVLRRDLHLCHYCGGHATVVDHVRPVARGGAHYDETNLVASCAPCNARKGGR